jgi:hypothetical protein
MNTQHTQEPKNPVVAELRRMMHHATTPSWANRASDEIERLEQQRDELQALKDLIDLKFTSGNSVSVERITITRAEYDAIAKAQEMQP